MFIARRPIAAAVASVANSTSPLKHSSKSKKTSSSQLPPLPVLTSLLPRNLYRPHAQFVRVHIYSVQGVAAKAKSGALRQPKPAIADILNEALRASTTGYRHLTARGLMPQPPRILHGPEPKDLWAWYEAHKRRAAENTMPYVVKKTGRISRRKQDVRIPTVLAEVMSYPGPPDDQDATYVEWRRLCVARLRRIHGELLVSVLEHTDEVHGHLHALVAHPDGSPVRALHPGHRAADRIKAEGGTFKEQQASYRAGLQDFQSDFYSLVGFPAGLSRLSASPKARVSYQQAQANRQAEREYADRVKVVLEQEKKFQDEQSQFTAMLLARAQEIEEDGQSMMQRAFQQAAEKVEAQNAKRAAELTAETERLAAWQMELNETEVRHQREKHGFAALTEHVRKRLRDADARYEQLHSAVAAAVDERMYECIMATVMSTSANPQSNALGKL